MPRASLCITAGISPRYATSQIFLLGSLTKILNMVPEDVISPIQRTAILLPTIIGGHWSRVSPSFSSLTVGIDIIPKHLIISTEEPISMYGGELVEMNRVKDGLIAAPWSRGRSITLLFRREARKAKDSVFCAIRPELRP